jgi:hypothetical protein
VPLITHRALARISEVGGIERSIRRDDPLSAHYSYVNYSYYAIRLMHVLHGVYCPYPKWMGRSLRDLEPDGPALWAALLAGFRVKEIGDYRSAVHRSYTILLKRLQTIYAVDVDAEAAPEPLVLLELPGIDLLFDRIRQAMPDEFKTLPTYIQPPAYWGMLFDYGGYDIDFKTLLAATQSVTGDGTSY